MNRIIFDDLVNQTENIVIESLLKLLEGRQDICTCDDCLLDMACYALNNLPPKYSASLMGGLYSRDNSVEWVDTVNHEVKKAIKKIGDNPLCNNHV